MLFAGIWVFAWHISTDPLVDARAYWEAGRRLNEGRPLYDPTASEATGLYVYPPLLAILFRPLALLPFAVAGALWEALMVLAVVLTIRRVQVRPPTLLAIGLLGVPLGWSLAIGQVEPLLTLFLAIATPWSVALAGQLKIVPWLAAVYWLGRRDGRALRSFAGWVVILLIVQLVLAPAAMISYLRLDWIRPALNVRNWSPFAVSPELWTVFALVLAALAYRASRGRWGWPLAVALAVLAYPRLLVYQLWGLMGAFGEPPATPSASRDGRSRARPDDGRMKQPAGGPSAGRSGEARGWAQSGRGRIRRTFIVRR